MFGRQGVQHTRGHGIEGILLHEDKPAGFAVVVVGVAHKRPRRADAHESDIVQPQRFGRFAGKAVHIDPVFNFPHDGRHRFGMMAQQKPVADLGRAFAEAAKPRSAKYA